MVVWLRGGAVLLTENRVYEGDCFDGCAVEGSRSLSNREQSKVEIGWMVVRLRGGAFLVTENRVRRRLVG